MEKIVELNTGKKNVAAVTPEASGPVCMTCPFWFARSDLTAGDETKPGGGECRLYPPTNFEVMVNTIQGKQKALQAAWVITHAGQWCGWHPERQTVSRAATAIKIFKIMLDRLPSLRNVLKKGGVEVD